MDMDKYMAKYGRRVKQEDNVNEDWYKAFYMCQLSRDIAGKFKLDNSKHVKEE